MRLCLVTDRRRLGEALRASPREWSDLLLVQSDAAARGGVDLIQVREPDLEAAALALLVRRIVSAVRGSRTRIVVNDRLDVAVVAGAHGGPTPRAVVRTCGRAARGARAPLRRLRACRRRRSRPSRRILLHRRHCARDEVEGPCPGAGMGRSLRHRCGGRHDSSLGYWGTRSRRRSAVSPIRGIRAGCHRSIHTDRAGRPRRFCANPRRRFAIRL